MSGSNSERALCLITLLLSDTSFSLFYATLENLVVVNINNNLRAPAEQEDIICEAAKNMNVLSTESDPPTKVMKVDYCVDSGSDNNGIFGSEEDKKM